jgi:hypothetical protein
MAGDSMSDGVVARTFPAVLGYGAALAATLGAFEYTGGSLWGYRKDKNIDKFEELEKLRKAYRTPAEETFAELGEGRGASFSLDSKSSLICRRVD